MDPLSVAASITGLLTASIQVAQLFASYIEIYDYARIVFDEIHHFRLILFRLDKYIHSRSISNSRASMIELDQVVTVLTGSVYTFSELEREVTRLQSKPEGLRRIWWAVARSGLVELVQRLQNHKGTICSMLLILTSESQDEALCGMHELQRQVAELVRINTEMARNLESATDGSGSTSFSGASTAGSFITAQSVLSFSSARTNFAITLNKSRVYRRALLHRVNKPGEAIEQLASAPSIQQSWSVLSGISLSEISNYAIYSLPISAEELFNPTWYTSPSLVVTLNLEAADMTKVPSSLIISFAEDLKTALKLNDLEIAKSIANYIPLATILRMSTVYPVIVGVPSNCPEEVLDNMTLFRLWLQCGGDTEAKDQHGRNGVIWALDIEDGLLFKVLVQNGSDVNSRLKSKTALHIVSGSVGEGLVIGLCVGVGGEDKTENDSALDLRQRAVEVLLGLDAGIDDRDEANETALHHASRSGHLGVTRALLSHGADIQAQNSAGWNALHIASVAEEKGVVEILLGHGADIEANDGQGLTALHRISALGHTEMIELLLSHGADIQAVNSEGSSALHCAAAGGQKEAVEVLLAHGANIEARNNLGTTTLLSAVGHGYRDIFEVLLRHGARDAAKDWLGRRAFDYAWSSGVKEVFNDLFDEKGTIIARA